MILRKQGVTKRCRLSWLTNSALVSKGVGRGPTLAWPGWKQPDISVKVDTARLEAGQFKKCCMECVLQYYPTTEFQSTFNVYWHGEGAAGLSCTELSIWKFPFLRGVCWQGWTSILWKYPKPAYTCMLSYSIDVIHLRFNFLCQVLL